DPNRELQNRGQDSDAIRLVEHTLRNAIRSVQYFLHDLPRIFDAAGFFVLRQKWKGQGKSKSRDKTEQSLFHSSSSGSFSGGGILRERYYARKTKSSSVSVVLYPSEASIRNYWLSDS